MVFSVQTLLWCLGARQCQTQAVPSPPPWVSLSSLKVGWLTHCWPSARPVTPYQADYPTFISLGAGGGTFWYSQVEAIDSLCTVVIYSILKGLFWVITSEKKHQSFDVRQRGANSHYTFTRVGKPFMNLFSLFKSTPKISSNSEGTMQLNLWNSIILKKSSVSGVHSSKAFVKRDGVSWGKMLQISCPEAVCGRSNTS